LLYHVTEQLLPSSDLQCSSPENLVLMANGENSRTLCDEDAGLFFQKGTSNPRDDMVRWTDHSLFKCDWDGVHSYLVWRFV
jgi:hypothetical protein